MYISLIAQIIISDNFTSTEKDEIKNALTRIKISEKIRNQCAYDDAKFVMRNAPENLSELMVWHFTPEGYEYWDKVNQKLTNTKRL